MLGKMAAVSLLRNSVFASFFSGTCYLKGLRKRVFHTFGLKDVLLKRLENIRISKPTAIQERALRPVLEGKNTIINAETGSGKTLCYLLPIINRLLTDEELLSKPPYAVVLLPSIELCNQVASVFQSLADNTMVPCIVHKESKLIINRKYPIILGTPDALFNYELSALNNAQVVVTDEADFLITGGGETVWDVLSFFKGVDSLKTKRKQRRLARRRKASRERNDMQDTKLLSGPCDQQRIRVTNIVSDSQGEFGQPNAVAASGSERQFVFVAATLPHRGPKAALNVLKEWIPEAEFVSTDLAHHPVPTVGIFYVRVCEASKLPELLRCLNILVGTIENPLTIDEKRIIGKIDFGSEENVDSSPYISTRVEVDSSHLNNAQYENNAPQKRKSKTFLETVSFPNLRVLVFANSSKAAERAFNFLSDIREREQTHWRHLTHNEVTTTTWQSEGGDDANEDIANSFVTHTGGKDLWKGQVGLIHKNLPVTERIETLDKFKSGQLKVLICTDLASRGLDIPDVSHVVQLDFAPNAAAVLHRTGRTARAGSSGKVLNFVTERDEDLVRAIRACEDDPNVNGSYQSHFSRNRQFRWRLKKKQQRQMDRQDTEGFVSISKNQEPN